MTKYSLLITALLWLNVANAQVAEKDSVKQVNEILRIQANVQDFFQRQHKRFRQQIKSLDKEYLVYCTPKYVGEGSLDIFGSGSIVKPTRFQMQDTLPRLLEDYVDLLLFRTVGHWCKERFGYETLENGDDFGILFVFSPKNMPDSISVLSSKTIHTDDYWNASPAVKRMHDLVRSTVHYQFLSEGLNERFIRVVLRY